MKKLAFRGILIMVLYSFGSGIEADPTAVRTVASNSTRFNAIFKPQEGLRDDYKALLLNFAINHLRGYKKNVVLSGIGCSLCNKILKVLMNAIAQSFFTVNDIAAKNYPIIDNTTEGDPIVQYDELVVFLMENVSEFFEHFAKLPLVYAWNPRAQHLIFIVKKPNDEELELIFEKCWSYKILNAAVIIWNQKEAYTYNPYLKYKSGMRENETNWSRLFYDKLRNMNGFPILTKWVPFSGPHVAQGMKEETGFKFFGSDFGFTEAFFQSVNATLTFVNLTIDTVPCYRKFTYRYSIWNERKFHDAELWMNLMMLQSPLKDRYERAYPLQRDNVIILAPKSDLRIPSIFEPYNNITWTCVGLSLITFALYYHVLYKWRGIDDNPFIRSFGIFLGKNLANRRHGALEKFIFLVFTMTSLLILSAYQGALYSALATVSYYPEVNTMLQLQGRSKTIRAHRILAEYLRTHTQISINLMEFDTVDYIKYMKTHRDEAYAFPNSLGQVTAKLKTLSENGIPFYHPMNEYSCPAFVSHNVPYGSPYLKKLERVFLACKEAGLIQYWEEEANLNDILSGILIPDAVEEKSLKKLSLRIQLTVFYIWVVGLLVSSLCFTAELYLHQYGQKILKKLSTKK